MSLEDPQRELLETAVEEGYFDVPRRTKLGDLADAHDLSDIEASRRLRHGIETVLERALDADPPE